MGEPDEMVNSPYDIDLSRNGQRGGAVIPAAPSPAAAGKVTNVDNIFTPEELERLPAL